MIRESQENNIAAYEKNITDYEITIDTFLNLCFNQTNSKEIGYAENSLHRKELQPTDLKYNQSGK